MNKLTVETIRQKIDTDQKWLERGILAIYARQTSSEKAAGETNVHNGQGFTAFDARTMTYYANWIRSGRSLSGKHLEKARRRMRKYAKQLLLISMEKAAAPVQTVSTPAPQPVSTPVPQQEPFELAPVQLVKVDTPPVQPEVESISEETIAALEREAEEAELMAEYHTLRETLLQENPNPSVDEAIQNINQAMIDEDLHLSKEELENEQLEQSIHEFGIPV